MLANLKLKKGTVVQWIWDKSKISEQGYSYRAEPGAIAILDKDYYDTD